MLLPVGGDLRPVMRDRNRHIRVEAYVPLAKTGDCPAWRRGGLNYGPDRRGLSKVSS